MTGDPITAALDQLAAHREQIAQHREQIAQLGDREAVHFATLSEKLAEITGLLTGIAGKVKDHSAALARLEALDRKVADLVAQVAGTGSTEPGADGYRPGPAPKWWKLRGQARQDAIARLRAWVEQVYRPGYGQLAATLGPCWEAHDLCLYGLDIASDLWSVLYLQDKRTPGLLSAQAEYQTRILPAIAEQLMAETSRCGHARARRSANGQVRSTP